MDTDLDWTDALDRAIGPAPAGPPVDEVIVAGRRRVRRRRAALGSTGLLVAVVGLGLAVPRGATTSTVMPAASSAATPTSAPSPLTDDDANGPVPLSNDPDPAPRMNPATSTVLKRVDDPLGPDSHATLTVADDRSKAIFLTWAKWAFTDKVANVDGRSDAELTADFDAWLDDLASKVTTDHSHDQQPPQ